MSKRKIREPSAEQIEKSGAPAGLAFGKHTFFLRFRYDETGEGFIDVLVKMLIVVVVGAVLLAIMRQAVPQLFTDMLTKIRSIFEV